MKKTKKLLPILLLTISFLVVLVFALPVSAADPTESDCTAPAGSTCKMYDWTDPADQTWYMVKAICVSGMLSGSCESTVSICKVGKACDPNNEVRSGFVDIHSIMPSGGAPSGGTKTAEEILNEGKPGEIMNILKWVVNILSGAIMVVAVIMLIIGAIQYSASGGDPTGVKAAKTKITNVLIGIAAYVFLYAFLQWLIPGGVFK